MIEAQAAGLPCLISDRITKEVVVTEQVVSISLDEPKERWAEQAVALSEISRDSYAETSQERVRKAGYDVKDLAEWYAGL